VLLLEATLKYIRGRMLTDRVPMEMDGWCAMWWHFYDKEWFLSFLSCPLPLAAKS